MERRELRRVQLALGPLVDPAYDLGPPIDELALHRPSARGDLVRIQRRALSVGGCVLDASDGRDARRSGTGDVVLCQEGVGGSGLESAWNEVRLACCACALYSQRGPPEYQLRARTRAS